MSSEEPPQSPFPPGIEPLGSKLEPPAEPRSPFAPGHQPSGHPDPRLGIVHLLVGTACVAIYLGLEQTARGLPVDVVNLSERTIVLEAFRLLYALGAGIALGGLLLWVARRLRGMPFPRHPGDYMLVVEGILCLLFLGLGLLWPLLNVMSEHGLIYPWWSGIVFLYVINALVWFAAARWIGIRAWRRFFFLCAGARLLACCLDCGGLFRFAAGHPALYVLICAVLVVIVVREHRRGLRYPWTHWLGVGIRIWFVLLNLVWFVLATFFSQLLFEAA